MKELDIFFDKPASHYLGETGEHLAVRLVIDVKGAGADWASYGYSILMLRPGEAEDVYVAAPSLRPDEEGIITYDVTSIETAIEGEMSMEIRAWDEERLIKSLPVTLQIGPSLGYAGGEVPEPAPPGWTQEVILAAEAALASAEGARASEEAAGAAMQVTLSAQKRQEINSKRSSRRAMITFMDDDGDARFKEMWEPIIDELEIPVCIAVITSWVGRPGNLTWDELRALRDKGVETLSHTHTHPLASALLTMEEDEVRQELEHSRALLHENGLAAEGFVYPGGNHDHRLRGLAQEYYRGGVQVGGTTLNTPPIATFALRRAELDTAQQPTFEHFKAQIDDALAKNGWIIFMSHSQNTTFDEDLQDVIRQMVAYARSVGVDIVGFSQGLDRIGNLVDVGDTATIYSLPEKYFAVDCDGAHYASELTRYNNTLYYDTSGQIDFATLLGYFPISRLVRATVPLVRGAGFPTRYGILDTWHDGLTAPSYQLWYDGETARLYRRRWDATAKVWQPFVRVSADHWRQIKRVELGEDTGNLLIASDDKGEGFALSRLRIVLEYKGATGAAAQTGYLYLNGTAPDQAVCYVQQLAEGTEGAHQYLLEYTGGWWDITRLTSTSTSYLGNASPLKFVGRQTPEVPVTRIILGMRIGAGSVVTVYGMDA